MLSFIHYHFCEWFSFVYSICFYMVSLNVICFLSFVYTFFNHWFDNNALLLSFCDMFGVYCFENFWFDVIEGGASTQ